MPLKHLKYLTQSTLYLPFQLKKLLSSLPFIIFRNNDFVSSTIKYIDNSI